MSSFKQTMQILSDAIDSICTEEFETLVEDCKQTILAGHKIVASGLGKNVPVCEKFAGSLSSVGVSCVFMHTNSAAHGDIGIVQPGDLVIILTKSGTTVESVYLAKLLKQRNCNTWLLSFSRKSKLYHELSKHIIVDLEHEGDPWNILPNNSTVINLIVLQELAMRLIEELHISIEVLKMNHPGGAIGESLSHRG